MIKRSNLLDGDFLARGTVNRRADYSVSPFSNHILDLRIVVVSFQVSSRKLDSGSMGLTAYFYGEERGGRVSRVEGEGGGGG